jgi:hypothetical protein
MHKSQNFTMLNQSLMRQKEGNKENARRTVQIAGLKEPKIARADR